ncbi:putative glucuronosyltransferase PGSIP8 [Glycine soja]
MAWANKRGDSKNAGFMRTLVVVLLVLLSGFWCVSGVKEGKRNAYAMMMYVGTPRDYEFYIAIRVLLKSLATLNAEFDLVVIASLDVPPRWIRALNISLTLLLLLQGSILYIASCVKVAEAIQHGKALVRVAISEDFLIIEYILPEILKL